MSIRQSVRARLEKTERGKRLLLEPRSRIMLFALSSFSLNLLYALYHGALGLLTHSVWFLTMCAYYITLSAMRLSAILCESKNQNASSDDIEYFVMKLCGLLLILLSFILAGVISISLSRNIAAKYGEITMITIAAYTFYKITVTIINAVKQRRNPSPLLAVLRGIRYAEVAASVLTLQRSMLVSFGDMNETDIHTMNLLTGGGVCLFVLILGAALIVRGVKKKERDAVIIETREKHRFSRLRP